MKTRSSTFFFRQDYDSPYLLICSISVRFRPLTSTFCSSLLFFCILQISSFRLSFLLPASLGMSRRAFTTFPSKAAATTLKLKTSPLFSGTNSSKEILLASNRLELHVAVQCDSTEVLGMDLRPIGRLLRSWFDEARLHFLLNDATDS